MLLRLVRRAHGVILAGSVGHLNVGSKDMRYLVSPYKDRESLDTGFEGGPVPNVKPSWINRVAAKKESGLPIVHRNGCSLVTGNREDIEYATAEIKRHLLRRPLLDTEKLLHIGRSRAHNASICLVFKLGIPACVVSMRVRVRHDQRYSRLAAPVQPVLDDLLHGFADGKRDTRVCAGRRAGIQQERLVLTEQQIDERRLVVDALVFAQHESVFVVLA